jgi:hypothetical protein
VPERVENPRRGSHLETHRIASDLDMRRPEASERAIDNVL